jgi:capsular exopolysaccharide synthesis family protein
MSETQGVRRDPAFSTADGVIHAATDADFAFASSVVMISRPEGLEAEACRGLRSHVMIQHLSLGRRALAVCAATADDGSTMVSANLAVALAQAGLNTLLVDANLVHPQIDTLIRPSKPVAGLAEHLKSDGPYEECIFGGVLPNLSVIYAGRPELNSTELLAGARFKALMDFCLRNFDATIVDTPPANRSHSVQQISALVGYSLVVACKDKTFVRDVKTLVAQLGVGGVAVIGTVMCEA